MDKLNHYEEIICKVVLAYTDNTAVSKPVETWPIIDREQKHFAVFDMGWEGNKRIHHVPIHIDIIGDKVWVQKDMTDSEVVLTLIEAGIPKEDIVLGFHVPRIRPLTEYATG